MEVNETFCRQLLNTFDWPLELDCTTVLLHSTNISELEENGSNHLSHSIISITMVSLFSIIFIGGALGNVIVLYVVSRFTKVKSVTNFYIINLALSDLLFLLGIPFLLVTYIMQHWTFGTIACKFYYVNTSLNQFSSSLFLTVMSADRYVAVCHPISAPRYRTPFISKCISVSVWTVASLMITPVFMYATTFEAHDKVSCNMFWPSSSDIRGNDMFIMYSFVLSFIVPLVLIFTFYSLVIWKLHSSRSSALKSRNKDRKRTSRSRITRLVMALIVVYIICWLPYWVLQLTLLNDPPMKNHQPFMIVCFHLSSFLSYANSAINPVLYTFMSDNFRNSFKDAFGRCCICIPLSKTAGGSLRPPSNGARDKSEQSIKLKTAKIPEERCFVRESSEDIRSTVSSSHNNQLLPLHDTPRREKNQINSTSL